MFGAQKIISLKLWISIILVLNVIVDISLAAALARLNDFIFESDSTVAVGSPCTIHDGTPGVCKLSSSCPWVLDGLANGSINHSSIAEHICGFMGDKDIVCCKEEKTLTPDRNKTLVGSNVTEDLASRIGVADAVCDFYTKNFNLAEFNVFGGVPAEEKEFPHMVALFRESQEVGTNISFMCGGSIISNKFILTAAHCVPPYENPIVVRVGQINIAHNFYELKKTDYKIINTIPHPNYDSVTNFHDIALVELDSAITFTEFIYPACLYTNTAELSPSDQLIVTGWGRTEKGHASDVLLKTNLTYYELQRCNDTFLQRFEVSHSRKFAKGLNPGQLCAWDPNNKRHDSCQGDSGGPLQIEHENGLKMIVGLTSFGEICGSQYPSIYTRVAYYISWIDSHVDWKTLLSTK